MSEESPVLLPTAEGSPAADTKPAAPQPELIEPSPKPIAEPPFICDCEEWMRAACKGEPFYEKREGKRYCVLHYPGKKKREAFDAALQKKLEAEDYDFRGVWFHEAVNFSGFNFSGEANFDSATFSGEANFGSATFNARANFFSATFSGEANFDSATFSGEANFRSATFNARANFFSATFNAGAYFDSATFSGEASFVSATFNAAAYFVSATFSGEANFFSATSNAGAYFESATFSGKANFRSATFNAGAYFGSATFSGEAYFGSATFSGEANFRSATFKDQVSFSGSQSFGDNSSLDLQFARIEKPERVSFHTVTLRPHWFVNVDPRNFVFTDIRRGPNAIRIADEIQRLSRKVNSPHELLAIACRQLAENAETNGRYEEASNFRYWAMDLARLQKRAGRAFWKTDWLHILYWAVSGYGERILRALAWMVVIWIVFALLYTRVGFVKPEDKFATLTANPITTTQSDTIGQPLPFKRAFTYSLGVMSLQKPEPKPLTGTAQTLVLLETILGPLQAALLALAIRRKFMR
jgi:hypothetical protein